MTLLLLGIYGVTPASMVISLLHAANMAPYFGIKIGFGPLWSLGVEEQFYTLWPLLVRRCSIRTLVFLCCAIFVNCTVLGIELHTNSPQVTFPIWYSAHGLAIGALRQFSCARLADRVTTQ